MPNIDVQSRRCRNLVIPLEELAPAVLLRLGNMEYLILVASKHLVVELG